MQGSGVGQFCSGEGEGERPLEGKLSLLPSFLPTSICLLRVVVVLLRLDVFFDLLPLDEVGERADVRLRHLKGLVLRELVVAPEARDHLSGIIEIYM